MIILYYAIIDRFCYLGIDMSGRSVLWSTAEMSIKKAELAKLLLTAPPEKKAVCPFTKSQKEIRKEG